MSEYSLKTIRDKFRAQGIFYTPPELAQFIMTLIPENSKRVYDPTCGRGSLLSMFGDDVAKYGQDIDASAVADAEKRLVNFHGAVGDVLSDAAFIDERFDAIVANPPFSIKWHGRADGYFAFAPTIPSPSKADFAFIIHILWMLSDDGTAVVLNSPGIGYRGGREQILRRWLVEQNVVDQVIHIPGNTFTDTNIATLCLVLKKNRSTKDVQFIDREHTLERMVTHDEIAGKDYSLSVSQYLQPVVEKTTVDERGLEMLSRAAAVSRIKSELAFSHLVSSISGYNIRDFVEDIRKALDEFDAALPALDNIPTMESHEENEA
jgi:type I restriction enzyme M protein